MPRHPMLALVLVVLAGALVAGGAYVHRVHTGAANPYGDDLVRVRVVDGEGYDGVVRDALGFWETSGRAAFDVTFEVVEEDERADIEVRFVDVATVPCGVWKTPAAGCGGVVAGRGSAVVATHGRGYDRLVDILAHEVGHALGELHTRDPQDVMYVQADDRPWWIP